MEQGAVGQIGQRIVMREMRDPLLDARALGDILVRRDPSAVGQRLVDDLDRAAVGGLDDVDVSLRDVAQDGGVIFVDVAGERSGGLSMRNDLAEAAARFHDLGDNPYMSI